MNFSLARCGTKAQSLTNKEGTQVFLFQRYLLSEVVSWGNHAFNLLSHSSTDLGRACQSPGLFWTLRFTTKIPAEGTYPGRKLERLESFNPIPEKTGLVPVHQIQNDVMTCFSFFFFFGPETLFQSLITYLIHQLTSQDISLFTKSNPFLGFLDIRRMESPGYPLSRLNIDTLSSAQALHGDHCERSADLDTCTLVCLKTCCHSSVFPPLTV